MYTEYYFRDYVEPKVTDAKILSDIFMSDDSRVEMKRIDAQKKNIKRSQFSYIFVCLTIIAMAWLSIVFTNIFILFGVTILLFYGIINSNIKTNYDFINKMTTPIEDSAHISRFISYLESSNVACNYAKETSKRRKMYVYDYWVCIELSREESKKRDLYSEKLAKQQNVQKLNEVLK